MIAKEQLKLSQTIKDKEKDKNLDRW